MLCLKNRLKCENSQRTKIWLFCINIHSELVYIIKTYCKYKEFLMECMKTEDGAYLLGIPELYTTEMCMEAVQKDGSLLKYVPEDLKTAEICMTAVQNFGQL